MYRCQDCEFEFMYAKSSTENHNLPEPPFERIGVCPNCRSRNFSEVKNRYCKYCGRRLKKEVAEYCSRECRQRGEIMWREQSRRKNLYEKNSLIAVTRELEAYNREHKTNYTYGVYVNKILTALKEKKQ